MNYIWYYESPLGKMTLASDGNALVGLWFDGQKHYGAGLKGERVAKKLPIFEETMSWLDIYFSGNVPMFTPTLKIQATPFRKAVWKILLTIPYGKTMTYGEIAQLIAKEKGLAKVSAQAVGGAVGHNPILLIIPCHRVLGKNNSLTGYAGGLHRKIWLLELEK